MRVAIVVSRYHDAITGALRDGAVAAFRAAGGADDDVVVIDAPGAFELPLLARAAARRRDIHGVVCLGCVIRGETSHDQHINDAVAIGVMHAALETDTPIAFGLLTCPTREHALARAGGAKGNKGEEAMHATLESIAQLRAVSALPENET